MDSIKQLLKINLAIGIKIQDCKHNLQCTACVKVKLTEMPYPKKSDYRAKNTLDSLHTDICGPMQVDTLGGKRYFIRFVEMTNQVYIGIFYNEQKQSF